ncbi:MAG TPA: hypothetical protein VJZ04_08100 [Lachnospiraceae bacterium]|nr:hypothetical protein [Lachnospiraceae bacterium]
MDELVIDGYRFGSTEDAALAKMELQKIEILNQRLDYSNPGAVALVYNKALENRVFKTPIGYEFLKSLQKYLLENEDIVGEVQHIPLYHIFSNVIRKTPELVKKRVDTKTKVVKKSMSLKTSIIINVFLILLAAAMFYITLDSKNPNIINYKSSILNEYAGWEQQLKQREDIVREREKEVDLNR